MVKPPPFYFCFYVYIFLHLNYINISASNQEKLWITENKVWHKKFLPDGRLLG